MGFIPPPIPTGDVEKDMQALREWCRKNDFYRAIGFVAMAIGAGIIAGLFALLSLR